MNDLSSVVGATQGTQTMPQYEFKIFSRVPKMSSIATGRSMDWSIVEQDLNGLLMEGWEVFSASTNSYGFWIFGIGSQDPIVTFTLRRPRKS